MCARTGDIAVSAARSFISSVPVPEEILGLEIGHAKGVQELK
jgi:hypothetical protein